MRNRESVERSALWSAWDANTKCYRRPAKVRKQLRRIIKHQQKQRDRKEIICQTEEGVVYMPHVRAHIRLNNQTDAMNLVQGLSALSDEFFIENFDGNLRANAKSIIGVMYAAIDYNSDMYLVNNTSDGSFPGFIDEYRV